MYDRYEIAVLPVLSPDADFEHYAIIRVDRAGIHVANDVTDLLGELIFDRLGVSPPPRGTGIYLNPVEVNDLTDNAYLDWALLQEVIIKHREKFEFELYYAAER